MITTHEGRTFDYAARLDPRNERHLVRDLQAVRPLDVADLWRKSIGWVGGPILDQGQEGSCVGHGVVGEYLASPARGVLRHPERGVVTQPIAPVEPMRTGSPDDHDWHLNVMSLGAANWRAQAGHELAVDVYEKAKKIDEWEGVDYEGTSVRAGMLVGRSRGWWDSFKWAKSLDDARVALEFGPGVIGVTWRASMYDAPDGEVQVTGEEVGGHCLVVTGYYPDWNGRGPRFRWRNSWGSSYGRNGSGYITPAELDEVLWRAGNEWAVPVGRHVV